VNAEAKDPWARAERALKTATQWAAEDPDASATRAYYAAFYAVSALFALEGRSSATHRGVDIAVHGYLVKTGRWSAGLGTAYSELLLLRQTADYGGAQHVTVADANGAVGMAEQILRAVRDEGLMPERGEE